MTEQHTPRPWWQQVLNHPWRIALGGVALIILGIIITVISVFIHYDRVVAATLKEGVFANASNIYAAPRVIEPGQEMSASTLTAILRRAGYTANPGGAIGSYALSKDGILIQPGPQSYFKQQGATVQFADNKIVKMYDPATGAVLDAYSLEPELITNLTGTDREKRRLVQFHEIPKVLVDAVVSIEDKRFFEHRGLDPLRLMKAAYVDLKEGRKEQGASTLTMQLARGLWLDSDKNWTRKARELLITEILEHRLSKQEIFTYYSNQVYLGRQNTYSIHGFGEAARAYFDRDIARLTLPQAALIAGIIQRPSWFNPFHYPDRAIARRNTVLHLMHQNGYIDAAEYGAAINAPLALSPARADASDVGYFLALVSDELQDRLPESSQPIPYLIYSTLDSDLQRAATAAIQAGMSKVDTLIRNRKGFDGTLPQAALIAIDPHTGEVKAAVGGRDYTKSQLNHLLSMRQPGSAFKPFVYAAALNSAKFTETSTVADEPTTITFGRTVYQPRNFERTFNGPVTLKFAMSHSLNVATVNLAQKVGYANVVALAKKSGLNEDIQATPAVALGAYETTPLEIAGAYTVFANNGVFIKPTFVKQVRSTDAVVVEGSPEQHRVLDERVTFLMRDMLQEVMRSGTAGGVWSLGFKGVAAGKTGTSRDGWFAGFTPDLICVVWVGFDDNRELDLEGAKSALPIWAEFMKSAAAVRLSGTAFGRVPSGIVNAQVDPESGLLAGPYCPKSQMGFYIAGTAPTENCPLHTFPDPWANTADRTNNPPLPQHP